MLLSKCAVCDSKKSSRRSLSSLGLKTPLSKISLVEPFLFQRYKQVNRRYKMNEIANKLLLTGDNFMPEKTTWIYIQYLQKTKKEFQKFKETGDSRYIYQNELDKACFQHDMAYGYFKDLSRRTASDKILFDKSFNIAKNSKFDGYQRDLDSMVYKFFDKKNFYQWY